ncbi:MAG: 50S ribosomal protein L21e [Candidatus Aenigmatarchaeota archaeon]|nr:50S ribosomal protein L21e [Candidatus Aenigmarchaeota archaeon]
MTIKTRGFRRKTRYKLKQEDVLKPSLFIKEFNIGDRVAIDIQSACKKHPHPKFQGRVGKVIGKRGKAYIIEVKDMETKKIVIARPEHLKIIKSQATKNK